VLAFTLADVRVRDPNPAVLLRVGDHALDQAPVSLLHVGAARDLRLCLAHPHHQRVANPLEVGRAQHPRAADRADAPVDSEPREGGRPELAELPLEAGDLAAQLLADGALVTGPDRELELVLCE
jgi:hypothetical protein